MGIEDKKLNEREELNVSGGCGGEQNHEEKKHHMGPPPPEGIKIGGPKPFGHHRPHEGKHIHIHIHNDGIGGVGSAEQTPEAPGGEKQES